MSSLQATIIILEIIIALVGLTITNRQKRKIALALSFTFICYVFYDLSRLIELPLSAVSLEIIFLAATISALVAIWQLKKGKI